MGDEWLSCLPLFHPSARLRTVQLEQQGLRNTVSCEQIPTPEHAQTLEVELRRHTPCEAASERQHPGAQHPRKRGRGICAIRHQRFADLSARSARRLPGDRTGYPRFSAAGRCHSSACPRRGSAAPFVGAARSLSASRRVHRRLYRPHTAALALERDARDSGSRRVVTALPAHSGPPATSGAKRTSTRLSVRAAGGRLRGLAACRRPRVAPASSCGPGRPNGARVA